nr:MAG TPA_asm: hypothetical protein [Caudoviricetes sp.]
MTILLKTEKIMLMCKIHYILYLNNDKYSKNTCDVL